MNKILSIALILCIPFVSPCQSADSLRHLLQLAKEDTEQVNVLGRLAIEIYIDNPDSALQLIHEGLGLAAKKNYWKGEAWLFSDMGTVYRSSGNYTKALEAQFRSLDIVMTNAPEQSAYTLHGIALLYDDQQELRMALSFLFKENEVLKKYPDEDGLLWNLTDIAKLYSRLGLFDSSRTYSDRALTIASHFYKNDFPGYFLNTMGELYYYRGQDAESFRFFRSSIPDLLDTQSYLELCETYIGLAKLFNNTHNYDSSVYYAQISLGIARQRGILLAQLTATNFLTEIYKNRHQIDSAFLYQDLSIKVNDSLFSGKKIREFQNIRFNRQLEETEVLSLQAAYRNRIRLYILAGLIITFLLLAIILLRSNRHKQKANYLLNRQKLEIDDQKSKIELAYQELQSAQAQLVHAEKMASLGELTAGIAHEIQNPLNFVNNFSEVNSELLAELKTQNASLLAGHSTAIDPDLIEDIIGNETRINFHGKRADAIVKGMLQHSRNKSGTKEPTDINKLAAEYLNLAYHGWRAKNPTFNATIHTSWDETIGPLNLIPQDIGRVLVNLFNNAFYAINERRIKENGNFEPSLTVKSARTPNRISITVQDNGGGIPQKLLDKIFQPFFTTKPAGEGTGLGLSLSYDIIKTHGGELTVKTTEEQGTEFSISLPLTS